jgi:predicted Zn-dependent protease
MQDRTAEAANPSLVEPRGASRPAGKPVDDDEEEEEAEDVAKADVRAAYKALAEAWQLFANDPVLGRSARYEQARCLFKAGETAAARKQFLALYAEALKEKGLLRLDSDFVEALRGEGVWASLMRQTATALVKEKKRAAALLLAQQCWQLGEAALAQHVYGVALADLPDDKERLPLQRAGLNFLMSTSQFAEADRALRKLLSDPAHAKRADLWRVGAQLAEQRSQKARQLECLEKALELEHASPPAIINLERVRADYSQLLEHYGKLADALVTLELPAPAGFQAKVVSAADRWRALDGNSERACQLAANTLQTLGERELAWDYLTTPAAQRPNEAEPWVGMASTLKRYGDLPLADRAYQAAFEAEPTNAEVLWDRAENLRQMGRLAQARLLYRQLADGDWQPRFRAFKDQARWALER